MTRYLGARLPAIILSVAFLVGCQETPPELTAPKLVTEKSSDYDYHLRAGNAANDTENYPKSEEEFRQAEDVVGPRSPSALLPRMSRALQVSNEGRFDDADKIFKSVDSALKAMSESRSEHLDPMLMARYELYLGTHEANRHNYAKAKNLADSAEQLFAKPLQFSLLLSRSYSEEVDMAGTLGDTVMIPEMRTAVSGLATTLELKQRIAYELKDYGSVERYHRILVTLLQNSRLNPPGILARSTRIEGIVQAKQGDFQDAGLRLDTATGGFESYQPKDRPIASTLFLAAIPRVGDDLDKALERLRHGKEIAATSHVSLPESLIGVYLSVLQQAMQKYPEKKEELSEESFDALQLAGGNVTAQVASKALARLSVTDPRMQAFLKDMEDADLNLRRLYFQKDNLPQDAKGNASPEQIDAIDQQIAAEKKKHDDAEKNAQVAIPAYEKLTSVNPSAVAVRQVLADDEGLLEFFIGDDESFGILVEKGGVTAYRINLDSAEAIAAVAALRKTIIPSETSGSPLPPPFNVVGAHSLYTTLFAQIDDRIPKEKPVEDQKGKLHRLTVIPNGPLSSLPFEILVTDETQPVTNQDYKNVPFLITKLVVDYTPSPQTLVVQRQNTIPANGAYGYIGFGDFQRWSSSHPDQLAASFPPSRCQADYDGLAALPPLPGTRTEILAVGTNVFHARKEDMVLGADFTKERLTHTDLTQYKVIHLATHAFLPTELHCRPEPLIVLSTQRTAPNVDDALLGLGDILALKLNANLVMLSACNTAGPSGATTGDSLSGLARAFFFAGARGLLVTHWDLEDAVAPLLTGVTVASGDYATGLRKAKLTIINKTLPLPDDKLSLLTHPYYWAPLVLIGDGVRQSTPAS